MNTKHYSYFLKLSESKNISAAARDLGVSQSVLSRYLQKLEQKYGSPMFDIRRGRLEITEAGKIYLNGIHRMIDLQNQMQRSLQELDSAVHPMMSIGLSPYRGGREIAYFYPRLFQRYPDLNIQLKEGYIDYLLDQLSAGKIDAMLNLYNEKYISDVTFASLTKKELFLILPSYHPLVQKAKNGVGSLTKEDFSEIKDIPFAYLDENTLIGKIIGRLLDQYDFHPNILLKSANSLALKNLISSGSYGGFFLEPENHKFPTHSICYFHLPTPVFVQSGILFRKDHVPSEYELFFYYLEYEKVKRESPLVFHINDYGSKLLYAFYKLDDRRRGTNGHKNI